MKTQKRFKFNFNKRVLKEHAHIERVLFMCRLIKMTKNEVKENISDTSNFLDILTKDRLYLMKIENSEKARIKYKEILKVKLELNFYKRLLKEEKVANESYRYEISN